jgi:hypothetical protein
MNKFLLGLTLSLLFFIPLILSADWCEYQKLETHYSNTSKGNWIDTESSYFNNDLGEWNGNCSWVSALGVGDETPAMSCPTDTYSNYTIPFSYCTNLTVTFLHRETSFPIGNYQTNLNICNQHIIFQNSTYYLQQYNLTNFYMDSVTCPRRNLDFDRFGVSETIGYDNITISCDFNNPPFSPPDNSITDEFYSYPKIFSVIGSPPNETYPNVTYKLEFGMSNYTPSCSDYDNINKYGYTFFTDVWTNPSNINWIKQTQSCKPTENQDRDYHYPFYYFIGGGCKAFVNYQDATLNCNLVKYNTTLGSDSPTMNIISPLNDTSIPIYNPISFAVNMSNNKCLDVWVKSTKSGYTKYTILNSLDGYYYTGIETLPNGTYSSDFICDDGCSTHNVTNTIQFQILTSLIGEGSGIKLFNSTGCMSSDTDLGKVASCYPNPITIPNSCSNVEVKEKTRVEYLDGYGNIINLDKCDSLVDGNFFNTNKFNMSSCINGNCGSGNYYCNETYNSKSKVETDLSGVITGYSEAYVPIECRCYYSQFIILIGYKIAKYRVYGSLEMSCDNTCNGNWVCSSSTQKAYMNTSCQLTSITDCSYMCLDGKCVTQSGIETNQTLLSGNSLFNKIFSWIAKPTRTQKMVMGFGGCIFFGVIGLALSQRFNTKGISGLLFMIMFGIGFAVFTFIGWIPMILIVLIIASIGVYMLSKFL